MKTFTKLTTLLTLISLATAPAFSQTTIPNGNFEAWQNTSGSSIEPTNWNGNKTGGGNASLGPQTCFRESTNPHSGSYCLKLSNGSFFGTPINATATTGRIEAPTTNPLDGYIRSKLDDANFHSPFKGRPDSLVGWYRFTKGGTDVGRIYAILHDSFNVSNPDQGNSAAHIIGEALLDLPGGTQATWTRFAIPFTYTSNAIPEFILLIATASGTPGSANSSTILWVDDLEAIYCSNALASVTESACGSYTSASGKTWTTTGTYQDTIVGAHGNCDSVYTINLTINQIDATVTDNGTSLTANATGASYQWVDCNNNNAAIPGETNAIFMPTATGDYAVEVTENSCTETSICYNLTITALEKLAFATNLTVYPNPTTGQFTMDLGATYNDVLVVITDINGKVVYSANHANKQLLNLNLDQAAGMYFVSVTSEKEHAVLKLIKQ